MNAKHNPSALERFPLDYLRELAFFGALPDEVITHLMDMGEIFELDNGHVLYDTGSKPEAFHIILSGQISLYREYLGKSVLTRTYEAGEQVGFAAILALHDHKGAAVAEGETWILSITSKQFFTMYETAGEEFAVLMINLARGMARTIDILTQKMASLQEQRFD
jgi:CRP/FNR family transcriptional regulator, cyclic AMP receptor protein